MKGSHGEYRVEEIARAAGVGVDTVRFYQSRGLLPSPARRGRVAIYSESHLERLREIRELNRRGLKLEAIGRVLAGGESGSLRRSLLRAMSEAEGPRRYRLDELAAEAGVPPTLLEVMRNAALLRPAELDGEALYSEADLRSARAARELLDAGIPVEVLLPLAQGHAAHVRELSENAIDIFEAHVRQHGGAEELSREQVIASFRRLLPASATLVSLHFQHTLIERVRARLGDAGHAALDALAADPDAEPEESSWS